MSGVRAAPAWIAALSGFVLALGCVGRERMSSPCAGSACTDAGTIGDDGAVAEDAEPPPPACEDSTRELWASAGTYLGLGATFDGEGFALAHVEGTELWFEARDASNAVSVGPYALYADVPVRWDSRWPPAPAVAASDAGYAVAWSTAYETDQSRVLAGVLDRAGNALAGSDWLHSRIDGGGYDVLAHRPQVRWAGDRAIVVWHDYRYNDPSRWGQNFIVDGYYTASLGIDGYVSREVQITQDAYTPFSAPAILIDAGDLVVAWSDYVDGARESIKIERSRIGGEYEDEVEPRYVGPWYTSDPALAHDAAGGVVIAWMDENATSSEAALQVATVDPSGAMSAPITLIGDVTPDWQRRPGSPRLAPGDGAAPIVLWIEHVDGAFEEPDRDFLRYVPADGSAEAIEIELAVGWRHTIADAEIRDGRFRVLVGRMEIDGSGRALDLIERCLVP